MSFLARLDLTGRALMLNGRDGALATAIARVATSRGAAMTDAGADQADLLANIAGPVSPASLNDMSVEAWTGIQEAELDRIFAACRAVLPRMAERGRGAIVTVTPVALGVAAVGLRAALLGLTRALAREAAPMGVRVNAVNIGPLSPPDEFAGAAADSIAETVMFLLSDAAAYVTGETLTVAGLPGPVGKLSRQF